MGKLMRLIVFFDLPTKTKTERRAASRFRSFLKKDGYYMIQWSVYTRMCAGLDSVKTHKKRLSEHLPPRGAIRALTLTEKQYESIDIILGVPEPSEKLKSKNILIL